MPTELVTRTMYTITGTNSGGSASAYINITVVDQVPTIEYLPNDLTLTNNTGSGDLPLSPTLTDLVNLYLGQSAHRCRQVLHSTSTGIISGTPVELLTRSMFTVTGTNTGGTETAYINITVVDQLSTIAYLPDDVTLTNDTVSSDLPLLPTVTGDGEILSWAISPSLPSGLSFDTSNGEITGIATELFPRTMFTVTGTNSGGTVSTYLNITVIDSVPVFEYVPSDVELLNNSTELTMDPISSGGDATAWTISPLLPTGLLFDTMTGSISGTRLRSLAESCTITSTMTVPHPLT